MKKFFAILLAVCLIAALAIPAMAAADESVKITVTEPTDENSVAETYTAYQLLSATKADAILDDTQGNLADGASGITYYATVAAAAKLTGYFTFVDGKVDGTAVKFVSASTIAANDQTAAAALLAIAKANPTLFPSTPLTVGEATTVAMGYYVIESSLGSNLIMLTSDQTIEQKNIYPSFTKAFVNTDDAHAAVGDKIEYTISVVVPATVNKDIVIVDTLATGLLYNNDFAVTAGSATASADGQTITFTVPASNADSTVTFTYSATLDKTAVSGTSYTNTAYLTYSNFQTPVQTLTTITNKLTVTKTDGTDMLAGAELQLLDADGNVLKLVGSGTSYRLAVGDESGAVEFFTSSASAATVIEGLDSDLGYQIAEQNPPAGYNGLTAPQAVAASAGNDREAEIINQTGTVLPSTGGSGVYVFYILGGVLVAAACVLLVVRKRMSRES